MATSGSAGFLTLECCGYCLSCSYGTGTCVLETCKKLPKILHFLVTESESLELICLEEAQ